MPVSKGRKTKKVKKSNYVPAGRLFGYQSVADGLVAANAVLVRGKEIEEIVCSRDPSCLTEPHYSNMVEVKEKLPNFVVTLDMRIQKIKTELARIKKLPSQKESYYEGVTANIESLTQENNMTILPLIAKYDTMLEAYADAKELENKLLVND